MDPVRQRMENKLMNGIISFSIFKRYVGISIRGVV